MLLSENWEFLELRIDENPVSVTDLKSVRRPTHEKPYWTLESKDGLTLETNGIVFLSYKARVYKEKEKMRSFKLYKDNTKKER
jgi:hypothetical protein